MSIILKIWLGSKENGKILKGYKVFSNMPANCLLINTEIFYDDRD
jgi:hypothetical protein